LIAAMSDSGALSIHAVYPGPTELIQFTMTANRSSRFSPSALHRTVSRERPLPDLYVQLSNALDKLEKNNETSREFPHDLLRPLRKTLEENKAAMPANCKPRSFYSHANWRSRRDRSAVGAVQGVWTNPPVRQNRRKRFWTHAVRPQGDGQDGPSQSLFATSGPCKSGT
jgi:hypothetical protein